MKRFIDITVSSLIFILFPLLLLFLCSFLLVQVNFLRSIKARSKWSCL